MSGHKIKILEKHCTVSREGRIALSNTLVETAVKLYNCPIRVTCSDYPGEECILTISDLTASVPKTGPHPDQFRPGNTYHLFYYKWNGTPIKENAEPVVVESDKLEESTVVRKANGTFVIKTPVVTTTYEEKEVTLKQYIGLMVYQHRKEKGLTQIQLGNLTKSKVSGSNIGQIESGHTNPILSSLEDIAEALEIHITDLFPPKNI